MRPAISYQLSVVRILVICFLFAVLCFLSSVLCGCQKQQLHKDSRLMMGTLVEVISPYSEAADIVFKEVERIENLLSIYKQDSQVSELNEFGSVKVSPELLFVINRASEFWRVSDGAFDITVGSLVKLWGFQDRKFRLPSDEEINQAKKLVGFEFVDFNGDAIELKTKGVKIDLGAIAKGYALDCAVRKLRLNGINSALLNAGGDVYCLGDKFGRPWQVAIKSARRKGFFGYLELMDKAVATSGGYEQFFSIGDSRYCHILNPKTGRPADAGVVSVSVIASDCLTADALATSIFVLGKEEGQELLKRFNAEARIFTE